MGESSVTTESTDRNEHFTWHGSHGIIATCRPACANRRPGHAAAPLSTRTTAAGPSGSPFSPSPLFWDEDRSKLQPGGLYIDPSTPQQVRGYKLMVQSEKSVPPAALAQLRATDPEARWHAVNSLAPVRTREAAQALGQALGDSEPFVRWAAAQALGDIARQARNSGIAVAATQAVLEAAAAEDAGVRAAAADAIAAWGPEAPLEPALELAHDDQATVRAAAVRALGLAGGQNPQLVVSPLRLALEDPDLEVRRMAANAIAWCREDACAPALRARLSDSVGVVRAAALRALGRLSADNLEASALPLLKDPDPPVRAEAIRCLRTHGSMECVTALAEMAEDTSQVGGATIGTLAQEASWHVQRRHMPWVKRWLQKRSQL